MFRQLTHAAFGATTLGARVMAKAVAVPVDTALWAHHTTNRKPPTWHSRNKVVLAAPFALLRDFSTGDDDVVPTLVFPPLAGHASCIIDKKGQSQIQLCLNTGLTRLYSFDWLSCTKATKDTTETDRLDFITRAADLIAGPEGKVNIVGNCQGGWEAALWAAMHPERVNTVIVAGAPIDTSAGNGPAQKLMPIVIPRGNMALYKAMVKANGGIVPGINLVMGFIAMHPITHVAEHLKVYAHVHDREYLDHFSEFYDWYLYPVNLPGKLYLWAVEHLFVKNEMFKGELEVAGDTVSLRSITCPVFLLGGEEDDITPWQQVHNMRHAVGSSQVRWYLAPGGHIGLFIGRQAQAEYWTPILAQVHRLSRPAGITNATIGTATRSAGRASENGLLNGSGDPDGAEQILRVRAGAGDERAARRLAELLAQRGDLDEAEQILRARADTGDESAVSRLAELLAGLLAQHGDLDEAEQILRARADTGDESAVSRLAELLAELLAQGGDPGKLRTRADTGDRDGATELAGLLEERADPDGALQILRAWANVGDWDAARSGHGTANVTGPRTGRQRLRATTAPGEEPDMSDAGGTTFLSVLRQLAETDPDRPALTCGDITLTRAGFVDRVERLAALFEARGVAEGSTVTIGLPNSTGFAESMFAAWAVGAVPQPVSHRLPAPERAAIMGLASPSLVVGMPQSEAGPWPALESVPGQLPAGSFTPGVSPVWKLVTSGGSTGRPKLIGATAPALLENVAGLAPLVGLPSGECALMTGPLSHNAPFVATAAGMLLGNHVVLMSRFDAAETLCLIEQHQASWLYLVPTMMLRIWRLPGDVRLAADVSSLKVAFHVAAPCPPWLKQAWIDWLGPQKVHELYAGTELQAATVITGTEWLAHPGSVGRPVLGEIEIRDPGGRAVPAGQEGEIWMRRGPGAPPPYRYIGATARSAPGGWESLGDIGHVDADGYVYITDRLTDMILIGGANVYPAEIEAALDEHPAVQSCCVIGLPHEDLGNIPHAIVELSEPVPDEHLLAHLRQRLAPHKLPRTIERATTPLRDDAGKVRRSALRAERLARHPAIQRSG